MHGSISVSILTIQARSGKETLQVNLTTTLRLTENITTVA